MSRKKRVKKVLTAVLIVILVAIIAYGSYIVISPSVERYNQKVERSEAVSEFRENNSLPEVLGNEEDVVLTTEGTEEVLEEYRIYGDLWNSMVEYNKRILEDDQIHLLNDPWAEANVEFNLSKYGYPSEVFGVLTIPKMEVEYPIYLGSSSRHMGLGAAQLTETSAPIGGESTNAVFAIHRYFLRDVESIEVGDLIYIQNPWEVLTYKVTELRLINPNERENITIVEGEDRVTLMTCHPIGSGGRYRYLVIAERVVPTEVDIKNNEPIDDFERFVQQLNDEGATGVKSDGSAVYVSSRRESMLEEKLPILCILVVLILIVIVLIAFTVKVCRKLRKRGKFESKEKERHK